MTPDAGMEVKRFAHDSRVPGWDRSVDLAKDPQEVPDPATTPVPADLRAEIERHMAKYPDRRSAAIPALAAAQRLHGWCSPEAFRQVACVMRLTPAYLAAVATFYDMLDTHGSGAGAGYRSRVYVCTNISCSLCGGRELLAKLADAVGTEPDVEVRGFECLGACDIAPLVSVDGIYVGPVADDEVAELAQQIRDGAEPLPAKQLLRRPSVDPGANTQEWTPDPSLPSPAKLDRATHPTDPLPPEPSAFGEPMTGDAGATPAPLEQAPSDPQDDAS